MIGHPRQRIVMQHLCLAFGPRTFATSLDPVSAFAKALYGLITPGPEKTLA